MTGTGLGLDKPPFIFDSISTAARAGNLVGAIVPMRSEHFMQPDRHGLLRRLAALSLKPLLLA